MFKKKPKNSSEAWVYKVNPCEYGIVIHKSCKIFKSKLISYWMRTMFTSGYTKIDHQPCLTPADEAYKDVCIVDMTWYLKTRHDLGLEWKSLIYAMRMSWLVIKRCHSWSRPNYHPLGVQIQVIQSTSYALRQSSSFHHLKFIMHWKECCGVI